MNVRRRVLWGTFALLAVPLLPACGSSSSGDGNHAGSDSGGLPQGSADGGYDSGGPTTGSGADAGGGFNSADAGGSTTEDAGGGGEDEGGGTTAPEGGHYRPDGGGHDSGAGTGTPDASPPEGGTITTPTTKATMYLDNWSGSFASWATKIDFTKMTHLLLAFATVSGDNSWNDLGDTNDVLTLVTAAHAKNVKVLVSIGGGGGDQTVISAYQSASNIAPLVASLDTMVKAMNLDGVDVDLESPGSMTSGSNYPAFISQLISTFHPEGKLVTTASAEYIVEGQGPDATIVAAYKSFDFINDMVYSNNMSDYTSEASWWTGSSVGLPKENLVWGLCFDGDSSGCPPPSTSTVQQITTASKAYGGIMVWDYTDTSAQTMWPTIQGEL